MKSSSRLVVTSTDVWLTGPLASLLPTYIVEFIGTASEQFHARPENAIETSLLIAIFVIFAVVRNFASVTPSLRAAIVQTSFVDAHEVQSGSETSRASDDALQNFIHFVVQ